MKRRRSIEVCARVQPGDWLHREEARTDRNGTEHVDRYRRRVLEVCGEHIRLSGIDRETPSGWEPCGGLMSMPTRTTVEKLQSTGYRRGRVSDG